jgi:hypothetical protein
MRRLVGTHLHGTSAQVETNCLTLSQVIPVLASNYLVPRKPAKVGQRGFNALALAYRTHFTSTFTRTQGWMQH